ncbi:glycosyltransferase family 2 protein [Chryseobacterium sp. MFBS3-17]|uniref:glycosyltransferase family 2 protein n=1 Tax=Chryseobacterium sp. MFBS3-17 TaxID=2886689 RepID=UPI001D0ED3E0|nr:glycosyltransferase family 2 protein [Chryseobacterium sp. MFBS3-17]MCC2591357.1 glycosyltransferase family 2 protein [Chryseobacterium sp. MFBS3-17]
MFSVVIPLYNKQESIYNTIKSVLNQTYTNFEIVLVNDGSTDNSLEVVEKIIDPRIRIIDKPNGGVSSARNKGIEEATKEWIAFLDGDDLWKENHLEEYNKAIINNKNLNWLFSGYTSRNSIKEYNFIYHKKGVLENIFVDLLNGIKIHTSAVCINKSLYIKYKDLYFTEGINNSEDREVWYKLCCIDQSPYYINKSLSIYTLDNINSLTRTNQNLFFLTMLDRLKNYIKLINCHDRKILVSIIYKINKIALYNRWDKTKKEEYLNNEYFNKYERKFLKIVPKKIYIEYVKKYN